MAITNYDRRLAIRNQVEDLLLLVTTVVASPTQQSVDALVAAINAGTSTSPLIPKPTYSLDGESYDWAGYANMLAGLLRTLDEAVQRARPYFLLTKMRP